jgi:biotin operon repressor
MVFKTGRTWEIYALLVNEQMSQSAVCKRLNIGRKTINSYVRELEKSGYIKAVDEHGKPKFYKSTKKIPDALLLCPYKPTPVMSVQERRVGLPYKAVDVQTSLLMPIFLPYVENLQYQINQIGNVLVTQQETMLGFAKSLKTLTDIVESMMGSKRTQTPDEKSDVT